MSRISLLSEENASLPTKELYQVIKKEIGRVPNVYQIYGHSPAALQANLAIESALAQGELSGQEVEIIALFVSEFNGCAYCLAAHTAIGKAKGMSERQIAGARQGTLDSDQEQALIDFIQAVLISKGDVDEHNWQAFLRAGYSEGAAIEVVAHIAKNVFNNYANRLAATPVDF